MKDGEWPTNTTVSEPILSLNIINAGETRLAEVVYLDSQEQIWRANIDLKDLDTGKPHFYNLVWNPLQSTFSFKVDNNLLVDNAKVVEHFSRDSADTQVAIDKRTNWAERGDGDVSA